MTRIDPHLERALLAVAVAAGTLLVLTAPDGDPILSSELLPVAGAVGVAIYAANGDCCGSCGCC